MTVKELRKLFKRYDKDDKVTIAYSTETPQIHVTLRVTTVYGTSDILLNSENLDK